LLSYPDDVANASAVDESIGTWYRPAKAVGGITGVEIAGCIVADTGENPETQNGSYSTKRTQSAASEDEDTPSQ
jgi:hypothetical protein